METEKHGWNVRRGLKVKRTKPIPCKDPLPCAVPMGERERDEQDPLTPFYYLFTSWGQSEREARDQLDLTQDLVNEVWTKHIHRNSPMWRQPYLYFPPLLSWATISRHTEILDNDI